MRMRLQARLAAPVVLTVLLLLGVTFAATLPHDHHGASETTCQICHVSHQPVDLQFVSGCLQAPALLEDAPVPADLIQVAGPIFRFTVSRAPPQS